MKITVPHIRLLTAAITVFPFLVGCADATFSATVFNPLNLKLPFLPYQEPVRIGVVQEHAGAFDPELWIDILKEIPRNPFRKTLQQHLGCPVQIENLKPFQMAAHLESGRLDFGLCGAKDYLEMTEKFGSIGDVIALSTRAKDLSSPGDADLPEGTAGLRRTIREGPFLASTHADRELVQQVSAFLLSDEGNPNLFGTEGLSGFRPPPSNLQDELERLLTLGDDPAKASPSD